MIRGNISESGKAPRLQQPPCPSGEGKRGEISGLVLSSCRALTAVSRSMRVLAAALEAAFRWSFCCSALCRCEGAEAQGKQKTSAGSSRDVFVSSHLQT